MTTDTPARWGGRPLAETRWTLELSRLLVDPVFAGVGVARGDRRPVMLMPGFLAGDQTLAVLAGWPAASGADRPQAAAVTTRARWAHADPTSSRTRSRSAPTRSRCSTSARRPWPPSRARAACSRGDGVVRWQAQRVPYADCVEVTGATSA
jgi:hypothetical protein